MACSATLADWAGGRVGLHFIPPGEPWRNGYVESFNSRARRVPQHQQFLVTGAGARGCQRLETRLQPLPARITGLPNPGPLCRDVHPPMNDFGCCFCLAVLW